MSVNSSAFSILFFIFVGPSFESISSAWAADDVPMIVIQQTDPQFPADRLAGPDVKVKKLKSSDTVPLPAKRNRWLTEAGLGETTRKWDEFAKDELTLRAHQMPPEELHKSYLKIDQGALSRFQILVQREWN